MKEVYKQAAALLVGGFLTGCRPHEEKHFFPTGQLKSRVSLDADGLYDGYSFNFTKDGALVSKVPFQHGEVDGMTYHYYPTGALRACEPNRHSRLNGQARYFFPNGKTKRIKAFQNDVEVGTSLHYYSSGRLRVRVQHNRTGKVVDLDAYTPTGQRDVLYTQALVLAASDTVPAGRPYPFDVVLANALSNAVTVKITSPGSPLDSLPAPVRTHRYVMAHPRPGANRLHGRVYNRVLRHDTLYTYCFDFQHTFWVRPAIANK